MRCDAMWRGVETRKHRNREAKGYAKGTESALCAKRASHPGGKKSEGKHYVDIGLASNDGLNRRLFMFRMRGR